MKTPLSPLHKTVKENSTIRQPIGWYIGRSCAIVSLLIAISVITITTRRVQPVAADPRPHPVRTLSTTTQFGDYEPILHSGIGFTPKLRIIEAIWAQLRADYPNDVEKHTTLYQQLSELIENSEEDDVNVTAQSTEAARKLQQAIGERLRSKNARLLAQLFSGNHYPIDDDQVYLCTYLLRQHAADFAPIIFSLAIDQVYVLISPRAIAAHLRFALNSCDAATIGGADPTNAAANVYETITKAQLYLFRKYLNQGDVNDLYLLDVAFYMRELKAHPTYGQQRDSLKRALDQAAQLLPANLRHLLLEPTYCLLNREYEEFIYTTNRIPIDDHNIFIFTWRERYLIKDNGIWVTHLNEKDDGDRRPQLDFTLALQSHLTHNFMYMARRISKMDNLVASWVGGKSREGSHWKIQPVEGGKYTVFSQDGFLMCAAEDHNHGEWRRFVHVNRDNKHTVRTSLCQWEAVMCPDSARLAS